MLPERHAHDTQLDVPYHRRTAGVRIRMARRFARDPLCADVKSDGCYRRARAGKQFCISPLSAATGTRVESLRVLH